MRNRDEELFRLFYFALTAYFSPLLSVSRRKKNRKEEVSFEEFYAFDSGTITLFSEIMKGVGRSISSSMLVFDKAYNYYLQFAKWTAAGVNFVCRPKDNAKYEVQGEPLFEKKLNKDEFGVYKVEHIHLKYKETVEIEEKGKKRKNGRKKQ